mmetsp:Transcript_32211/g.79022  ORF Transcript_32211/g.79022 Transcript_32211/m.79022 type:complete len:344 (-) Transcript_32211:419-1450(-)
MLRVPRIVASPRAPVRLSLLLLLQARQQQMQLVLKLLRYRTRLGQLRLQGRLLRMCARLVGPRLVELNPGLVQVSLHADPLRLRLHSLTPFRAHLRPLKIPRRPLPLQALIVALERVHARPQRLDLLIRGGGGGVVPRLVEDGEEVVERGALGPLVREARTERLAHAPREALGHRRLAPRAHLEADGAHARAVPRALPRYHLHHTAPKAPCVRLPRHPPVRLGVERLGRHVVEGAIEPIGELVLLPVRQNRANPEVGHDTVVVLVDEQVLRLQVRHHDALRVQLRHRHADLAPVLLHLVEGEPPARTCLQAGAQVLLVAFHHHAHCPVAVVAPPEHLAHVVAP